MEFLSIEQKRLKKTHRKQLYGDTILEKNLISNLESQKIPNH